MTRRCLTSWNKRSPERHNQPAQLAKFQTPRDLMPDRDSEVFIEGPYYGAIVFHDNIY
jgi:hypothetical protein